MNELRMYVEHLFEGKVLTSENIDLKEEIYGNLVARYEDLMSEGVDEAEALRRTKESIASLDDVFAEGGDAQAASCDSAEPVVGEFAECDVATRDSSAAVTTSLEAAQDNALDSTCAGGPAPIAESDAAVLHPQPEQPVERRRAWPLVLVSVVGILVFLAVGAVGCSLVAGIRSLDAYTDGQNVAVEPQNDGENGHVASGSGTATPAIPSDEGVYVDPNGPVYFDGEPADELVRAVVGSTSNDVLAQSVAGLDDVDALNTLISNLPMGEWAANLDVTRGNGVLRFDYVRAPDYFDGDSIDLALAYNATALFCAAPEVQKIQVTVSESDEVNEHDYYVFDRAAVEEMYGVALDADMVNEAGWGQLKGDNLYKRDFAERMVDRAENNGR